MKIKGYLLYLFLPAFTAGCSVGQGEDPSVVPEKPAVTIRLADTGFVSPFLVDEDNLAVEQTINNLSLFFSDPGSDEITYRFVQAGFHTVDDYKVVSLPLDPADLGVKDIYVVTNFGSDSLNTVPTISRLKELKTPVVNKALNLDPAVGFCMYGRTGSFDFTSGENAVVHVARTCAKYRINLSFPEEPGMSTDNSFVIAGAASYTFLGDDVNNLILHNDEYFNFATRTVLTPDGEGNYTGLAYVYEASRAPEIYLYIHPAGGAEQVFSADLPIPERNYLYDIQVYVYQNQTRSGRDSRGWSFRVECAAYDPSGRRVE